LGARVHVSGDQYHTGKITKQGRCELRAVLIASAWLAVRWSDHWRELFQALLKDWENKKRSAPLPENS
jgi:transposase